MKTQFASIGTSDLIKGAIIAGLTVLLSGCAELLSGMQQTPIVYPNIATIEHLGVMALTSFVVYICKNFLTNSHDEFLKKES